MTDDPKVLAAVDALEDAHPDTDAATNARLALLAAIAAHCDERVAGMQDRIDASIRSEALVMARNVVEVGTLHRGNERLIAEVARLTAERDAQYDMATKYIALHAQAETEVARLRGALENLLAYLSDHDWGYVPEPDTSIDGLIALRNGDNNG